MIFEVRRAIKSDHPSLPGHFPGAPLVPGVVILDEVLDALTERFPERELTAIRTVKFLAPLKPEQPFAIRFAPTREDWGQIKFCCYIEERVIVEGLLEAGFATQ